MILPLGIPASCLVIPTPFHGGPVNVYLPEAEPFTLIDVGPDTPEARKALTGALAAKGLTPRDIRRVLLTHAHVDHAGLAGWLQELGAEVYLHPGEKAKLSALNYYAARLEFLKLTGVPPAKVEELRLTARQTARSFYPLAVTKELGEGDIIPFAGFSLTVLEVPGHSLGHLAFFAKDLGLLFSGDVILKDITPNPLPEISTADPGQRSASLSQFMVTLDRLELLPVKTLLPGHGGIILDHRRHIDRIRAHHRKRLEQVRGMLKAPLTPFALAAALYGPLSGWDILLGVSEALSHLDLLKEAGEVEEFVGLDGLIRFVPA